MNRWLHGVGLVLSLRGFPAGGVADSSSSTALRPPAPTIIQGRRAHQLAIQPSETLQSGITFFSGQSSSTCGWHKSRDCNGAGAAPPAHGAAPGLPLPPDGRGAHHALPRPQGRRRPLRRARRRRGRPQQVRALGPAIACEDGGEGVVLLLPQGPQVPDGAEDEQGHGGRVLEGHGQGQGHLQAAGQRQRQRQRQGARRLQEDARLLHGEGPQGREVRLGHARVPPPRQAPWRHRPQGRRRLQERVGVVQGVQEEPRRRWCSTNRSRQKGRHGDGQDGRHSGHISPPSADGRVRRRQPRSGGTRDLLLRRAGGPSPVLQPAADAARSRRHGRPRPLRALLAVPVRLRALRAAAASRRREPGAAPGGRRVRRWRQAPGHVGQATAARAGAGAAVQTGRRAGAAERVAGHGAHLRRAPRDLLLLRRPTVRPRLPLLGRLLIKPHPHIITSLLAKLRLV